MSLTLGTGPFGRHPAGVFNSKIDGPKHLLYFEPFLPPRAYLPLADVRMDLLTPTDKETVCPYKGIASYWSAGDLEDIAWSYRNPIPEAGAIEGLVGFMGDGVEVEIARR